eukprot:TRINITY_DN23618_c0_g1_i1.p1 TRINITY_DN23618_c0_g1~~TRINITY_DN23618_c0_g1_i1.p1  ORF type:complete len:106 (+),score=24.61 TRINITY_DN23618_c0_g1_i1:283-600(+)
MRTRGGLSLTVLSVAVVLVTVVLIGACLLSMSEIMSLFYCCKRSLALPETGPGDTDSKQQLLTRQRQDQDPDLEEGEQHQEQQIADQLSECSKEEEEPTGLFDYS